jgi:hypothetical protein
MYNQIRGSGWAYYDGNNEVFFIARGHNRQMLTESLIVMILCKDLHISIICRIYILTKVNKLICLDGTMIYAMIQLIEKAEELKTQKKDWKSISKSRIFEHVLLFTGAFMGLNHVMKLKQ